MSAQRLYNDDGSPSAGASMLAAIISGEITSIDRPGAQKTYTLRLPIHVSAAIEAIADCNGHHLSVNTVLTEALEAACVEAVKRLSKEEYSRYKQFRAEAMEELVGGAVKVRAGLKEVQ